MRAVATTLAALDSRSHFINLSINAPERAILVLEEEAPAKVPYALRVSARTKTWFARRREGAEKKLWVAASTLIARAAAAA
jgi:hypothetical protein